MTGTRQKDIYRVGVLGATGIVGQNYIKLLDNHPWFSLEYLAASPASAGKIYPEAVKGRWHMKGPIPYRVSNLMVEDASNIEKAKKRCDFVFSAVELGKEETAQLESAYATAGIPVFSNASAHRWTENVPMLIPEINGAHINLIDVQRKKNNGNGFIVVKPNCSIQSFMLPIYALDEAGYDVNKIFVNMQQAISGAGYPGVASLDITDNIIPFIKGEQEKTETEPLKIFGTHVGDRIIKYSGLVISAKCMRIPVTDGHTASVSVGFRHRKPRLDEIIKEWSNFQVDKIISSLPSSPEKALIYTAEEGRPQPKRDRDNGNGMAVTVGMLETCNILDIKFVGLSHNTIRGAAGGGILNAEYVAVQGYM